MLEDLTPQQLKAKGKRLWKCYRWTLEMYRALGDFQGWKCAGCGREAKAMPLNIDHIHFHIDSYRIITDYPTPEFKWEARVVELSRPKFQAKTKIEAMRLAREDALPHSVRGLLCAGRYMGCNRKLGRIDDPVWLESMLRYVKDPPTQQMKRQTSTAT